MSRQKGSAFMVGLAISMLLIFPLAASACSHPSTTTAPTILVTLVSESNPASPGAPVTFFASVKALGETTVPTGTVTFNDGSTALGTVTLDQNGLGIYTAPTLAPGSHQITASYSGDSQFASTNSGTVVQTVGQASSTPTNMITTTIVTTTVVTTVVTTTAPTTTVPPAVTAPDTSVPIVD